MKNKKAHNQSLQRTGKKRLPLTLALAIKLMKEVSRMKILHLAVILVTFFCHSHAYSEDKKPSGYGSWTPTVTNEIFGKYLINQLPIGYLSTPIKTGVSPDGKSFTANYARVADTPTTWTEMVAIEAFKGYASNPKMTPRIFLDVLGKAKGKYCEKSFYSILGTEDIGKYMAASMVRGCGSVQSPAVGLKIDDAYYELYIAIAVGNDMYLLSRFVKTQSFDPKSYSIPEKTVLELKASLMPISVCSKIIENKCAD
jgi:hypothetical protein